MKTVEDRVYSIREKRGDSMATAGAVLGISSTAYRNKEIGQAKFSIEDLKLLAAEWKVNFMWLADGTGDVSPSGLVSEPEVLYQSAQYNQKSINKRFAEQWTDFKVAHGIKQDKEVAAKLHISCNDYFSATDGGILVGIFFHVVCC